MLHPPLTFSNVHVGQIRSQKHLGKFVDSELNFNEHLEKILTKINRSIAIIWNLQSALPRDALLTLEKLFINFHFDTAMWNMINRT